MIATDIDLMTTYLGAAAESVEAVLASVDLEVLPVSIDQRLTLDSDTINPLSTEPDS